MAANVFVFGAGGHAKVIVDILERTAGVAVAFIADDAAQSGARTLCGYRVVVGRDELLAQRGAASAGIVAIGDNAARLAMAAWLLDHGFMLARAVHPDAVLARGVSLGDGTAVMAGCVVNTDAAIGANVILNTGATVDHDCTVEDGVHIAPGCHVCGGVLIGAGSFLGAGTTVIPGIRIGAGAVIGAGSTVLGDVAAGARVAGSPARPLEHAR